MEAVAGFDRITVEPGKCGGKPCIRGMRITVRRVVELLAMYEDRAELLCEYPYLEEEDLRAAERFWASAGDSLSSEAEGDGQGPGEEAARTVTMPMGEDELRFRRAMKEAEEAVNRGEFIEEEEMDLRIEAMILSKGTS